MFTILITKLTASPTCGGRWFVVPAWKYTLVSVFLSVKPGTHGVEIVTVRAFVFPH